MSRFALNRFADNGFTLDAVLTAEAGPGSIVLTVCPDGANAETYKELVKSARRQKAQILQVRRDGGGLFIFIPAYLLVKAGFAGTTVNAGKSGITVIADDVSPGRIQIRELSS